MLCQFFLASVLFLVNFSELARNRSNNSYNYWCQNMAVILINYS